MDILIIKQIVVSLALGFIIGIQRALGCKVESSRCFGGGRTFALISLLGFISAWLNSIYEHIFIISFFIISSFLLLSYFFKISISRSFGLTTYISAILTFVLGAMSHSFLNYAVFLAVLVIVILEIKPKVEKLQNHISTLEIEAVTLLLVMSFVVLPLLPDKMIGPYNLFNPYKTWLMAIVIASISFVGYIAIKLLGQKHGIFLTGAAGGLISSTAVTISLSKLYNKQKALINSYAGGIAIASTLMYIRVLFEAFVIYPKLAFYLIPAYGGATLIGFIFCFYLYKNSPTTNIKVNTSTTKNPLELNEAIKFAILFGIIYGAISFVETRFGDIGIYLVSFISGIIDIDAITLSLSQMSKDLKLNISSAMLGIIIASATNSIIKLGIVFWLGGVKLGLRVTQFFIITLGVMILGFVYSKLEFNL